MTAAQKQILERHEVDPVAMRERNEEQARQRRIAGVKARKEQMANRSKASLEKRAWKARFMNGGVL